MFKTPVPPDCEKRIPSPLTLLLNVPPTMFPAKLALFSSVIARLSRPLPLEGIRIVEFVHVVMGPTCGMVLADLYTAISGIGYLIVRTAGVLEVDRMFVPIVTLGLLGVTLTWLLRVVEIKVAPWTAVQDQD